MLTTIPNNNPHKRNRLIFKWLSGNDPCFVSLLGFICLNTGGHPSLPSCPSGGGEKTPPASRVNSRFFPHKSPQKPRNRLVSRGMRLLAFLLAIPHARRKP